MCQGECGRKQGLCVKVSVEESKVYVSCIKMSVEDVAQRKQGIYIYQGECGRKQGLCVNVSVEESKVYVSR